MADDYCELCDLPRSQCVHGMPAPAPPPPTRSPARSPKPAARKPPPKAPPARPRRWTPPEVLAPVIVSVLEDAGGELEAEDLFAELEVRVEDHLLAGDREKTPEGELRWQYAARRARQALIKDGRMTRSRPGLWELASTGR